MNKRLPLLLIVLIAYIFTPSIITWVTDPVGNWYRPFIVWLFVIFIAFGIQQRDKPNDV